VHTELLADLGDTGTPAPGQDLEDDQGAVDGLHPRLAFVAHGATIGQGFPAGCKK
jgi:hypothetical protein